MRILYVALTRAKEKLILTGAVGNIEKATAKWLEIAHSKNEKFPAHNMLKAQNYLNWVCPAIMRHADSKVLQDACGLGVEYNVAEISDESKWCIYLYEQKDVAMQKKMEIDEDSQIDLKKWLAEREEICNDYYREIDRRLSWKYKYENLKNIPSKISVTELKRYFNINNEVEDSFIIKKSSMKKPTFLQQRKGLSSAEKGTTMHFVMQHIDFYNNDIENQISKMVGNDLITEQQAKSVDITKIRKFISSSIGKRMIDSGKVHREVPFNIELPYSEIFSDHVGITDEKILLQGVIDCYFEEDNKIILIDYKTDFVADGNIEEIKAKYSIQISYYAKALELLTQFTVAEKYIYLFSTGQLVDFNE
jgi:ATP-dependent helicase/nuclease subunit A